MSVPYQMLHNLTPREMTASQQREADEQLGQITAAVTRYGHRIGARVHAVATLTARQGTSRRLFERQARLDGFSATEASEHGSRSV